MTKRFHVLVFPTLTADVTADFGMQMGSKSITLSNKAAAAPVATADFVVSRTVTTSGIVWSILGMDDAALNTVAVGTGGAAGVTIPNTGWDPVTPLTKTEQTDVGLRIVAGLLSFVTATERPA